MPSTCNHFFVPVLHPVLECLIACCKRYIRAPVLCLTSWLRTSSSVSRGRHRLSEQGKPILCRSACFQWFSQAARLRISGHRGGGGGGFAEGGRLQRRQALPTSTNILFNTSSFWQTLADSLLQLVSVFVRGCAESTPDLRTGERKARQVCSFFLSFLL